MMDWSQEGQGEIVKPTEHKGSNRCAKTAKEHKIAKQRSTVTHLKLIIFQLKKAKSIR